jgi:hypothetical protein
VNQETKVETPYTSDMHVIVMLDGQSYALPLLGITRKHVVTKFGKTRFNQVVGYQPRWLTQLKPNGHLFPLISR